MLQPDLLRFGRTVRQRTLSPLLASLLLTSTLAVAQPVLIKDIYPGATGSNAQQLTNVNGTLYFTAQHEAYGNELWRSNGTAAGTTLVKDLSAGPAGSFPQRLTNVGGTLYFVVGNGLYRTNGTATGTVLLKGFSAPPAHLTDVNGTLYFAANDGVSGVEVWRSDGTAPGTKLVKDLVTTGSASPSGLLNAGGTLYFSADGGLYKSDGTAAGTVLVRSFPVPLLELTYLNGAVYFTDQDNLWKTDGTPAGTALIKAFPGGVAGDGSWFKAEPRKFAGSGGKLFFITTLDDHNLQLWKSDGTPDGTVVVTVLGSVSVPTVSNLVDVQGTLFYAHSVGSSNESLYKTDGTTVTRVKSFGYGPPDLHGLTNVNGRLYFAGGLAPLNEPEGYDRGVELWTSDGTPEGTVLVADLHPYPDGSSHGSFPSGLTNLDGVLYFTADNGTLGQELWTYTTPNAVPPGLRLNAGGNAYRTPTDEPFSADAFFSGGRTHRLKTAVDFAGTEADTLYQTERWGTFSYNLPVENGSYLVVLHFAESYWGYTRKGGAGSRRFNVDVEGERRLYEYDIFATAGGPLKAIRETLKADITDGTLNLDFGKGSASFPSVSAIEVIAVSGPAPAPNPAARAVAARGDLATEAWQARVHPNPVADQLTVRLPFGVAGVQATTVTDATGNVRLRNAHRPAGENQLQIATGGLPKGIYLLRLHTDQGSRVVRFVKQ
ncbi:MAG: T9SS type A sorting domain-containing protein [Cytophagales bacterium]|nr:T9SS type A sorting domain-containing protein [Cytophagales bacterium]